MCGRFSQVLTWRQLHDLYVITSPEIDVTPRYNIRPTNRALIVRQANDGGRELASAVWWLVPPWADKPDQRFAMFNARAETLSEKKAFAGPFKSRRCLIPFTGWYEWRAEGKAKQPYFMALTSGPFAVAGLWDISLRAASPIVSCTVVTVPANDLVAEYHPKRRMPAILKPDDWGAWLDTATVTPDFARGLLAPWPSEEMTVHAVDPRHVNAPSDTPLAIEKWSTAAAR